MKFQAALKLERSHQSHLFFSFFCYAGLLNMVFKIQKAGLESLEEIAELCVLIPSSCPTFFPRTSASPQFSTFPLRLLCPHPIQNLIDSGNRLLSVSTSPRLILEFGGCKREDWLQWYIESVRCEINGCENLKVGKAEVESLVVVDDEAAERIVGFAVWSWSAAVSSL